MSVPAFEAKRWPRWAVLALVAVAATALRWGYVREVGGRMDYVLPQVDAADYHAKALQVQRGEGLGPQVYYKAPAYAYTVGQIYRVAGPRIQVVYVVQMVGGVIVAVLVAWLGMRWFGLAAGLLAGLLAGLYPRLAYYENQLLIESLALTVSMLGIACALSRRPWMLLAAGLLLGYAVQLRPLNALVVVAVLPLLMAHAASWAVRSRSLLLVLLPVLLALVPTARHNRQATGRLVPISVNGGINFYIGNNLDYDDTVAIRPGLRWEELTKRFGNLDDPVEWERGYYTAATVSMRAAPWEHAKLFLKKGVLLWTGREIDRNQDSGPVREASRILRGPGVSWALLALGGLVGAGLAVRRLGPWHPFHGLLWLQALGVVAFFVTSRYRLALVPWLALGAGLAAVEIAAALWRLNRSALILRAAWLAPAAFLVLPDWYGLEHHSFGRPEFDSAMVLARAGERSKALEAYEEARERYPDDPDVVYRYGEHLELMGRRTEAIGAYERAAALAPRSYKPCLSLGVAHLLEDDLDSAWAALEEAERRGDPTGRTLYDMGLVLERQGRIEAAAEYFERSLSKPDAAPETALRRLALARCLVQLRRPEVAEVHFQAAGALLRDPNAVGLERAEAWLRAGEATRALALLQRVAGIDSSARGQYIRARALQSLGRLEEARAAAARAVALDPGSEVYERFHAALAPSP